MAGTWITDLSHFLDPDGSIQDLPVEAARLLNHLGAIVEGVSGGAVSPAIPCRRRPGHRRCPGAIASHIAPGTGAIVWQCPACGDNGIISNWRETPWDRSLTDSRPQGSIQAAPNPIPTTSDEWLSEIARAFQDAREAVPFIALTGAELSERSLFHLAPIVCMKFRGLRGNKALLGKATEAALSSVVANKEVASEAIPEIIFAFAYLASHVGANLIAEDAARAIMEFVEQHAPRLRQLIKRGRRE